VICLHSAPASILSGLLARAPVRPHISPIHPSPLINQGSMQNVFFLGVTRFKRMHRLPLRRPRRRDLISVR